VHNESGFAVCAVFQALRGGLPLAEGASKCRGPWSGDAQRFNFRLLNPLEVVMKRVFGLLLAVIALSAVSASAADSMKVKGWISDSMCGAKHMGTGAACVKKCIKGGAAPVFVDDQKAVWTIENPDAVKGYYGDHVAVEATTNAEKKSVHIDSVAKLM
jgi:hypothetical protein